MVLLFTGYLQYIVAFWNETWAFLFGTDRANRISKKGLTAAKEINEQKGNKGEGLRGGSRDQNIQFNSIQFNVSICSRNLTGTERFDWLDS